MSSVCPNRHVVRQLHQCVKQEDHQKEAVARLLLTSKARSGDLSTHGVEDQSMASVTHSNNVSSRVYGAWFPMGPPIWLLWCLIMPLCPCCKMSLLEGYSFLSIHSFSFNLWVHNIFEHSLPMSEEVETGQQGQRLEWRGTDQQTVGAIM